eukprot:ANDGO_00932.mRNA.1 hypothetical protein (macronuclear)
MHLQVSISLAVLLPIFCGILAILIGSALVLDAKLPEWSEIVEVQTLANEKVHVNSLSVQKALLTNEYLYHTRMSSYIVQVWAQGLFGNSSFYVESYQPEYNGAVYPQDVPPGLHQQQNPKRWISLQATAWYQPDVNSSLLLDQESKRHMNVSSLLRYPFRAVYLADQEEKSPGITNLYMGFQAAGFFRTYPYRDLSSYLNFSRICENGPQFGSLVRPYIPLCRPWFSTGESKIPFATSSELYVTSPYVSSSGLGLLLASGTPIMNGSELLGVIALELPLDALQVAVSSVSIMQNGYVYLYDRRDSSIVFHSRLSRSEGPQNLLSFEFGSSTSAAALRFQELYLPRMNDGQSGAGTFEKDSGTFYIAFAASQQNFTLVAVVPMSDILKISKDFRTDVQNLANVEIIVLCIVSAVLLAITILIVFLLSSRIIRPLRSIQAHLQRLDDGELGAQLETGELSQYPQEIQKLLMTFEGLTIALRLGNETYLSGNLETALQSYVQARDMFQQSSNMRGVGVCENNIGNVYYSMKQFEKAEQSYRKAIRMAEADLPMFPLFHLAAALDAKSHSVAPAVAFPDYKSDETNSKRVSSLVNRMHNLALLMKDEGHFEEAEQMLLHCIAIERWASNLVGLALHSGSLGELYMKMKNFELAISSCEESFRLAAEAKDTAAQQEASLIMAHLEESLKNYDKSLGWYQHTLVCRPVISVAVQVRSLSAMIGIYTLQGATKTPQFAALTKFLEDLRPRQNAKDIVFVLDTSGSMSGNRILDAQKNMHNIYSNLVTSSDRVSLITFSSHPVVVFPLHLKGGFVDEQMSRVQSTSGSTAFFDALEQAIGMLSSSSLGIRDLWIVALTDGEDNSSKADCDSICISASKASCNIIIVSVGNLSTKPQLEKLCGATPKGLYIEQASNLTQSDWSKTVEVHIAGNMVVESY